MKSKLLAFIAISLIGLIHCFGQTPPPNLTSISPTPEGTMTLYWQSITNSVYEIEEADSLNVDTNTGVVDWNILTQDYPSQGTNTFWLDTGNYNNNPNIVSPKYSPMRFYRVLQTSTNTIAVNPTVAVTSLTNSQILSGEVDIQVSAYSPDILSEVDLYVDGQEMQPSMDGTNFFINTCEWWNGQHVVYAVAKSESEMGGPNNDTSATFGHTVSPMINVTFNNLVTEIAFSQPNFQPSLGETQEVTAYFPLNSDWTLQIEDAYSNVVRTVTGSGNNLDYLWDGTGTGETNIADGIYNYYITAETNGEPNVKVIISPPNTNSPPTPDYAMESGTESLWAVDTNAETVVPMILYPPGFDTNDMTIISATPAEASSLRSASSSESDTASFESSGFEPAGIGGPGFVTPLPDPQTSPPSPQRPPDNPIKNNLGSFGIAYIQYLNTNLVALPIQTGWPYLSGKPYYVTIDGGATPTSGTRYKFGTIPTCPYIANSFSSVMQHNGFSQGFIITDDEVTPQLLEKSSLGGSSVFNSVNFGILMTHGSYSTVAEDDGVYYSYLWIESLKNQSVTPIHLSDMDLGSAATNGLKWMTIFGCDVLNQQDYLSMSSKGKNPCNGNLHALLGASTVNYYSPYLGINYAQNLVHNESVIDSWTFAGTDSFNKFSKGITNDVNFAWVVDGNCVDDTLTNNAAPGAGLQWHSVGVYTLPP